MTDYYLVRDWSNADPDSGGPLGKPVDSVVYGEDIWKVIDEAREKQRKISIYKVGDCLLDWS